ncbi:MAG: DUF502 domain-containing protein [Sphingobacteriia bacterium]|nr:DUF502 domain-containing protein [Sphingobacteriia bacterium]
MIKRRPLRTILLRFFGQGLLFLAPLGITVYIIWMSVDFINSLIYEPLKSLLGITIPGLGIVVVLLFITLIGFLGSSFIFSPLLKYFDELISRAPLIKIIYTAVKDLLAAFVGNQKKFTEPVLVSFGSAMEMERIGFLTRRDLTELGIDDDKVAVYFPASYSIMGEVIIVPAKNVKSIPLPPAVVMKYLVSGGVSLTGEDSMEGHKEKGIH